MIKVKLRQRPITDNRQALYLDFYPAIIDPDSGDKTRREFLNLYLFDEIEHEIQNYADGNGKPQRRIVPVLDKKGQPKKIKLNPIDKQHNKETQQTAKQIRQKRDNAVNKPEIYTGFEKEQLKIKEKGERSFVEYFKSLVDKRKGSNSDNWTSAYNYLLKFTGGKLKFSEVNERWCNDFGEYLLTSPSIKTKTQSISQNSAVSYFNKLKAALKQAYKDGYLSADINAKVDTIKATETKINFLTLEELQTLAKTECKNPVLKSAALFSAMTGMAFKEIQNLVWGEVEHSAEMGYFIPHRRQKTGGNNYLNISEQAFSLMGERKANNDKVFEGLNDQDRFYYFQIWIASAGIKKDINFHGLRHTFATLQLSMGTDIYTVSKMLDHKNVRTTQVYAKVINQTKREAADKIKLDL
jgi:integrase